MNPTRAQLPAVKDRRADLQPYLENDWQLIPLHRWNATSDFKGKARKDGKRPLHNDWTRRAYDSRAVINEFGFKNNLGVRLRADQLVIDVDIRRDGEKGFSHLCFEFGLESESWPCVITGSGGKHYYLRKPEDISVLDSLGDKFPGVEFKSIGRQVVAAGSIHPDAHKKYPSRNRYRWSSDNPPLSEAKSCPADLLEAIRRPDAPASIGGGQFTQDQIESVLADLDVTEFSDHDKWLEIMLACHHATAGDARQEFIDWSVSDPEYEGHDCIIGRRWDSLHKDRGGKVVTVRTLIKALMDQGLDRQAAQLKAQLDFGGLDDVEEVLKSLPNSPDTMPSQAVAVPLSSFERDRHERATDTFRNALVAVTLANLHPAWNTLKQKVVIKTPDLPWPEHYGREVNDHVLRLIRAYLIENFRGERFEPSRENVYEALYTIAYANKFNPITDYFDSLQWDGVKRVERLFPDYFNCGDDAYTRAVSLCCMIGAVRRARKPGCKFDTAPILLSAQGWNKSTGIAALAGDDWFSDADLGNFRNKDALLKIRETWIYEFADLDNFSRADVVTLKAFLSRRADSERDPYGRVVTSTPRHTVFWGTGNEGGYLKDLTGGRRFWPLTVQNPIEVAAISQDRDQLWAEAATLEADGVPDVLPEALWPEAAKRQESETTEDPWADVIRSYLETRAKEFERYENDLLNITDETESESEAPPPPPDRVHSIELFGALGLKESERTQAHAQRLRKVMVHSLGWLHAPGGVRVGHRTNKGYARPGPKMSRVSRAKTTKGDKRNADE